MNLLRLFKGTKTNPAPEAAAAPPEQPAPKSSAAPVPTPARSTAASESAPAIPSEKIAQRAYQIWCERGKPMGTAHDDWVAAESQLRAEYGRPGR
jgi:hypothetical protein